MNREQEIQEHNKIIDERFGLVVKSNSLIQNTQFNLTELEQKIVIYVVSKITKDDLQFKHITFSVKDYCRLTGLSLSGNNYEYIKKTIQGLSNKSWWVDTGDNKEVLFRWVDTAEITRDTGLIHIVLSESLKPFLLELKKSFTQYRLINVLCLHSKHSIRLYELFKSNLYKGELELTVEEFKHFLGIENKYKQFNRLNIDVIQKSIDDINTNTDLDIKLYKLTKGKKIEKLMFKIRETKGADNLSELYYNQQISLKDIDY